MPILAYDFEDSLSNKSLKNFIIIIRSWNPIFNICQATINTETIKPIGAIDLKNFLPLDSNSFIWHLIYYIVLTLA